MFRPFRQVAEPEAKSAVCRLRLRLIIVIIVILIIKFLAGNAPVLQILATTE